MKGFLLLTLLLLTLASEASEHLEPTRTIQREATFGVLPNTTLDDEKNIGHDARFITGVYLQELSDLANIKHKVRTFESENDLLQAVKSGEIDAAVVNKFSVVNNRFDYYLSSPIIEEIRIKYYSNVEGGVIEKKDSDFSWVCETGTVYCSIIERMGIKNIIYVESQSQVFETIKGLVNGATITTPTSLLINQNSKELTEGKTIFDARLGKDQSVIVSRRDSLLSMELDRSILKIKTDDRQESITSSFQFQYVKKAYEYLFQYPHEKFNIKYSLPEQIFPYSYSDDVSGEQVGYIHDILQSISDDSFTNFEYVKPQGRNIESMLENGIIDLIPFSLSKAEHRHLFVYSMVFDEMDLVLVEVSGSPPDGMIGMPAAYGDISAYLSRDFGLKYIIYDNHIEKIEALKSGEISKLLINEDVLNNNIYNKGFLINTKELREIKLDIAMAMKFEDVNLLRFVNNELSELNMDWMRKLRSNHKKSVVNYGVSESLLYKYSLFIFGFLFILLCMSTLWFVKQKNLINESNQIAKLNEDQVEWLASILDKIPMIICLIDKDGDLVLSNSLYKSTFGNEVNAGFSIRDVVENTEYDKDGSGYYNRCNDKGLYYKVYCSTITNSDRNNLELITIVDVSELKARELDLIESRENVVNAINARSKFLAVVSHELKTPLSALLGLMEMLLKRSKDEESTTLLKNAMQSANRLRFHVNDLLDFSKIDAGQLSLDIQRVNIREELSHIFKVFEPRCSVKNIDFIINWKGLEYSDYDLDSLRVNQIMNNLLSNAIKFTSYGKICVNINAEKNSLSISVMDTGCGMSEEEQKTIFEPFVQANNTISRKYGGTGLGMSIVYNLVNLMGGSVTVSSRVDLGTTITISIPTSAYDCSSESRVYPITPPNDEVWYSFGVEEDIATCDIESNFQGIKQINDDVSVANTYRTFNKTVLFVDDEPVNRLVMQKQLNEFGINVVLAPDALKALSLLTSTQTSFDLIITDYRMPQMDGFELSRRVRAFGNKISDIPIIACTAEDSGLSFNEAMSSGIDDVIYKPYNLNSLYKVIDKYFSSSEVILDIGSILSDYSEPEKRDILKVSIQSLVNEEKELERASTSERVVEIAHKVKGIAAILELDDFWSVAFEVDLYLKKNGDDNFFEQKSKLSSCILNVISNIEVWLSDEKVG